MVGLTVNLSRENPLHPGTRARGDSGADSAALAEPWPPVMHPACTGILFRAAKPAMTENERVEVMDRLCRLAVAECEKCAMGLEPEKINGFWRHGHDFCRAGETHERISVIDNDLS